MVFLCFVIMGLSPYIFPTANFGYLVCFGFVFIKQFSKIPQLLNKNQSGLPSFFFLLISLVALMNAIINDSNFNNIFRDIGIIISFVVGRYLLFTSNKLFTIIHTLSILTIFGNLLGIFVMVSAALAYKDGASAYFWRGSYIPPAHAWLPFFLVINVGLLRLEGFQRRYILQALFCVVGTLASLSRTDLLLEVFFGVALITIYWRKFITGRGALLLCLLLGVGAVAFPAYLNLDVVQERFDNGISEDVSLGWRFVENEALFNYLNEDYSRWVFGSGFGAVLPLPLGMLDPFDGKPYIPFLHNSYLTIILKAGVVGLVCFLIYVIRLLLYSRKIQSEKASVMNFIGTWFIVFILGKAFTLQGLTEWSFVLFFGLGVYLIARTKANNIA